MGSALLLAATASAASPQQQVLDAANSISEDKAQSVFDRINSAINNKISVTEQAWFKESAQKLQDSIHSTELELDGLWDEVSKSLGSFTKDGKNALSAQQAPAPKAFKRKHDSEWDHIISGKDVRSSSVQNVETGQEERMDGDLDAYTMRTKKVDPAALGVDRVKQYSGYLDDDEEDKHLFYCMLPQPLLWFYD